MVMLDLSSLHPEACCCCHCFCRCFPHASSIAAIVCDGSYDGHAAARATIALAANALAAGVRLLAAIRFAL